MKWRGPIGGGAASGKLGALVASRAKSTQYLRARTTPVNPNSIFQRVVRDAVKALTSLWSQLPTGQLEAWNVYAANVTVTNKLGDSAKLSGFNWFIGNNVPRVQAGFPAEQNAPTIFDIGNPNWSALLPEFTTSSGATTGTLALTGTLPATTNSNSHFYVYVSRPQSAGKTFFNGPFQFAGSIPGNTSSPTHIVTLPFTAAGVGNSDSANFMDFVLRLDNGDGRLSSKFQSTLVAP